jgi:hypothetical protein
VFMIGSFAEHRTTIGVRGKTPGTFRPSDASC